MIETHPGLPFLKGGTHRAGGCRPFGALGGGGGSSWGLTPQASRISPFRARGSGQTKVSARSGAAFGSSVRGVPGEGPA